MFYWWAGIGSSIVLVHDAWSCTNEAKGMHEVDYVKLKLKQYSLD